MEVIEASHADWLCVEQQINPSRLYLQLSDVSPLDCRLITVVPNFNWDCLCLCGDPIPRGRFSSPFPSEPHLEETLPAKGQGREIGTSFIHRVLKTKTEQLLTGSQRTIICATDYLACFYLIVTKVWSRFSPCRPVCFLSCAPPPAKWHSSFRQLDKFCLSHRVFVSVFLFDSQVGVTFG